MALVVLDHELNASLVPISVSSRAPGLSTKLPSSSWRISSVAQGRIMVTAQACFTAVVACFAYALHEVQ